MFGTRIREGFFDCVVVSRGRLSETFRSCYLFIVVVRDGEIGVSW